MDSHYGLSISIDALNALTPSQMDEFGDWVEEMFAVMGCDWARAENGELVCTRHNNHE